jgi:hypothetical protein
VGAPHRQQMASEWWVGLEGAELSGERKRRGSTATARKEEGGAQRPPCKEEGGGRGHAIGRQPFGYLLFSKEKTRVTGTQIQNINMFPIISPAPQYRQKS